LIRKADRIKGILATDGHGFFGSKDFYATTFRASELPALGHPSGGGLGKPLTPIDANYFSPD
jgi:hypothetical protein